MQGGPTSRLWPTRR